MHEGSLYFFSKYRQTFSEYRQGKRGRTYGSIYHGPGEDPRGFRICRADVGKRSHASGGVCDAYLAIRKNFEPLLLVPIAFGCILVNIPLSGIMDEGGFLYYVFFGTRHEIYPVIIFMGVGALTDFAPLLANPITFLLGASAQLGVFVALFGALMLGFNVKEAASIAIIGGADGPTSIYLTLKLAPQILGAVAVAAYSYMALVPLIQPPVIRLLTTKKDRAIRMDSLRPVSKLERVLFPIVSTVAAGLILPASVPLIGLLMFGNLLRECGVTERLNQAAQNE